MVPLGLADECADEQRLKALRGFSEPHLRVIVRT